ncbi:type II toxin-antitoxin system RelE/ParE family toxin [Alteraurantiacibacter palmitatis]|uniref:Type II toxin-antitoxin system RelE/ParE family toxin n=1 Tax=Alteraurantiacibacter palmitatis TaxID=2054628 RepID=A0ABV7E7N7_9SPHN
MEIASIRHKALRRLFLENRTAGVIEPARLVRILQFLVDAHEFDELREPPNFGFHPLTGDRAGSYAIVVTRNWRLTFAKVDERTIADLDLEDYH